MVEPFEEAAAAAEACFGDDVFLLDLVDAKERRAPRGGGGGGGGGGGAMFLDIFDHADEGLAEGEGGGEEELEWLANKDAFPALETSFDAAEAADAPVLGPSAARVPVRPRSKGRRRRRSSSGSPAAAGARRRCRHCAAEETPQWRAGPEGPKTLCNACGVRFKSGRLVPEYRPARSPTFVPALHSNSHRRILEMRRLRSPSPPPPPPPPPPRAAAGAAAAAARSPLPFLIPSVNGVFFPFPFFLIFFFFFYLG